MGSSGQCQPSGFRGNSPGGRRPVGGRASREPEKQRNTSSCPLPSRLIAGVLISVVTCDPDASMAPALFHLASSLVLSPARPRHWLLAPSFSTRGTRCPAPSVLLLQRDAVVVRRPGKPTWVGGASQIRGGIDPPRWTGSGADGEVGEEEEDGDRAEIDRGYLPPFFFYDPRFS
jgi:hypothetical protein